MADKRRRPSSTLSSATASSSDSNSNDSSQRHKVARTDALPLPPAASAADRASLLRAKLDAERSYQHTTTIVTSSQAMTMAMTQSLASTFTPPRASNSTSVTHAATSSPATVTVTMAATTTTTTATAIDGVARSLSRTGHSSQSQSPDSNNDDNDNDNNNNGNPSPSPEVDLEPEAPRGHRDAEDEGHIKTNLPTGPSSMVSSSLSNDDIPLALSPSRKSSDNKSYGNRHYNHDSNTGTGNDTRTTDTKQPIDINSDDDDDNDTNALLGTNGNSNNNGSHVRTIRHMPALHGCRSVDEYKRLNTIGGGTYGVVHRAADRRTGDIVALKKIKFDRTPAGFPITSLREINILLAIKHDNIVQLKEIVVDDDEGIYMVMEYMEHDLKVLLGMMKQPFGQSEVKLLMRQLLEAIACMHEHWVIHRDLKTSNLLYGNNGTLKVCDFGLARKYDSPIGNYTELVVTLWYRAPELLLGTKTYGPAVDMWSIGCIFAELLTKKPLLPAKTEIEQISKMFELLGTPSEDTWEGFNSLPHTKTWKFKKHASKLRSKFPLQSYTGGCYLSANGFDLLTRLLCYDPKKRITAAEALRHAWFNESPKAQDPALMPTFPSLNEGDRKRRQAAEDGELNDIRHMSATMTTGHGHAAARNDQPNQGFFLA